MTLVSQHIILQSPASNDPLLDLNTQPSLDLQFATKKTLDDRVSGLPLVNHQRDASSGKSAGTYVGSDGLIKTSVVNLVRYSEQFDQSIWNRLENSGTLPQVTPNLAASPDGSITADRILCSKSGNTYSIVQQSSAYSGNETGSIYLKSNTNSYQTVYFRVGITASYVTVSTEWQRFPINSTYSGNANFTIGARDSSDDVVDILAWGAQLEENSTASTYVPTTTVASAAPRFDHDPVTGESLGLLIEESRTNLAKYSEPDDRSTNNVSGEWYFVDLDPNTEITKVEGPDGVSNSASEMQLATGNGHDAYLNYVPVTAGASYTFSAWVKLGTATNLALHVSDTAAWDSVPDGTYSFDVNDGLNTNTFVKVSHTFTAPSTGRVNVSIGRHLGTAPVQQTQGTVTVWGCQLELGAFSSSTIITTGSTVTRAADVASIEGTNFSSWYNQSEGTVFAENRFSSFSTFPIVWAFRDAIIGSDNYIAVLGLPSGQLRYASNDTNVSQWSINMVGVIPLNTPVKTASVYKTNDIACSVDGAAVLTDTSATITTAVDRLHFGFIYGSTNQLTGHISRLAYYPYRLADATLQEITS